MAQNGETPIIRLPLEDLEKIEAAGVGLLVYDNAIFALAVPLHRSLRFGRGATGETIRGKYLEWASTQAKGEKEAL